MFLCFFINRFDNLEIPSLFQTSEQTNYNIKINLSKMDPSEQAHTSKIYAKKLYCSEHGNKFVFKCDYQFCTNPFVCSAGPCFEGHFHHENQGKLVLVKFDSNDYSKKFAELERVFTRQDFATEAKTLKSFIDELKQSMVTIYKDFRQLHIRKETFSTELNKPFEIGIMEKVDETIALGNNLRKNIDTLKTKVNIPNQLNSLQIRSEEAPPRPSNANQSPINLRSQSSQKKANFETSDKKQRQSNKQYEQGEVIFQSLPKNNTQVPIELQISHDSNPDSSYVSQGKPALIISKDRKDQSSAGKVQASHKNDIFEQLFENGPSKNHLQQSKDAINVDKVSVTSSSNRLSNLGNSNSFSNSNGLHQSVSGNNSLIRQQNGSISLMDSTQNPQYSFRNVNNSLQNLKIYERDFLLKKELTIFLERKIKNFSWGLCQQLYSTYMPLKSIDKFHQMLEGKKYLLFVFIGQSRVVGSFYPSRYPRLTQKLRNDSNSFLFISNNEKTKILDYKAIPSEFHLSVSDRLYICHGNTPSYADGIRVSQKSFEFINYCLPTLSYKHQSEEKEENSVNLGDGCTTFNGNMKVKEFFVLQFMGDTQN